MMDMTQRPVAKSAKMPASDKTLRYDQARTDVYVSQLTLSHFRNYPSLRLSLTGRDSNDGTSSIGPVILFGPNGSGKTNLLEALSLLAPGRGLRRAARDDLLCQSFAAPSGQPATSAMSSSVSASVIPPVWAVSATIITSMGPVQLSTGLQPDKPEGARHYYLDGIKATSAHLAEQCALSWLTPQMDGLFIGSPSSRRRFIDRLVIAFDPAHSARLSRYEKLYRERQKLIQSGADDSWFRSLEIQLAENGVAVMAARTALVRVMSEDAYQGDRTFGFPRIHMAMQGGGCELLDHHPALEVEDQICADAAVRRNNGDLTMLGPQAQDLVTIHLDKGQPAHLASTGEQKALLIAAILAHARLQETRLSRPPLLLLDDVAAHLDERKRGCLFAAISELTAQVWYSGTDEATFAPLKDFGQFLHVQNGQIS